MGHSSASLAGGHAALPPVFSFTAQRAGTAAGVSAEGGPEALAAPRAAGTSSSGAAGEGDQVNQLLRSGKPALSVSESTLVANFLARQKDLLILCGSEGDTKR